MDWKFEPFGSIDLGFLTYVVEWLSMIICNEIYMHLQYLFTESISILQNVNELFQDFYLLLNNAMVYNEEDAKIHKHAVELENFIKSILPTYLEREVF